MPEQYTAITEFNSNVPVIKRINEIIDHINNARNIEDIDSMIKWVLALYKEVYVELTKEERKIRTGLIKTISKAQSLPKDTSKIIGSIGNGRIFMELDDIDTELRSLAKKHGLLSSNKDDPKFAMLG